MRSPDWHGLCGLTQRLAGRAGAGSAHAPGVERGVGQVACHSSQRSSCAPDFGGCLVDNRWHAHHSAKTKASLRRAQECAFRCGAACQHLMVSRARTGAQGCASRRRRARSRAARAHARPAQATRCAGCRSARRCCRRCAAPLSARCRCSCARCHSRCCWSLHARARVSGRRRGAPGSSAQTADVSVALMIFDSCSQQTGAGCGPSAAQGSKPVQAGRALACSQALAHHMRTCTACQSDTSSSHMPAPCQARMHHMPPPPRGGAAAHPGSRCRR